MKGCLEKTAGVIACALVAVAILSAVFGVSIYKFKDCRKVGHTFMYCILEL